MILKNNPVKRFLMIYPPWALNSTPPIGLTMLQGFIVQCWNNIGIQSQILDLNAVAAHKIPYTVMEDGSHRTHRSILRREGLLKNLSGPSGYSSIQTYRTLMQYYKNLLDGYSQKYQILLTPGDFVDHRFSGISPEEISRMLNMDFHPLLPPLTDNINEKMLCFKPDTIGISIIYKSQLTFALALVSWLKNSYPFIRVILGGALLSGLGRESLKIIQKGVHALCKGQGELFMKKLSSFHEHRECLFVNPDYDGIDMSLYFSPVKTLQMITSRGCYWGRCTFCDECSGPFMADHLDAVVKRINALVDSFSVKHIHFTDHAIPPSVLKVISRPERVYTWSGFVRVMPELADKRYVKQLADSGCKMLQLGLETPDQDLLNKMNKGIDSSIFPVIIENLREYDIRSYVYLMFGHPGQSYCSCELTLSFLEKHQPDYVNLAVFNPQNVSTESSPSSTQKDRSFHAETLEYGDLRRWISSRLHSSPIVRTIMKNTPHYYKSSHAVYF